MIYNLKMMAAALQYIQENNLLEYGQLEKKANEVIDRFHDLSDKIKTVETGMGWNAELKAAMVDYAKTHPVFEGYRAARYSKKYLAEHEADIQIHRAAKATFTRILDGGKLPKMDALKAEYVKLSAEKKDTYGQCRAAQKEMHSVVAVKASIDHLLGLTRPEKNKEMYRLCGCASGSLITDIFSC